MNKEKEPIPKCPKCNRINDVSKINHHIGEGYDIREDFYCSYCDHLFNKEPSSNKIITISEALNDPHKFDEYIEEQRREYEERKYNKSEPSDDLVVQPNIDLWEKNTVVVTCPFCHKGYYLAPKQIEDRTKNKLIAKFQKKLQKIFDKQLPEEYDWEGDFLRDQLDILIHEYEAKRRKK